MGDAKNHNAAASAFGWEFQVNAAMVLFIRNLPEAASVIVEGACDDIEINLEVMESASYVKLNHISEMILELEPRLVSRTLSTL